MAMDHPDAAQLLGILVAMLVAAKALGWLARRVGQPAVLGELIAGVLLGGSVLGWVPPHNEVLAFLAELGVIILLVEIGLETDLRQLVRVGGTSTTVAVAGVVLPLIGGDLVCRFLGLGQMASLVAGAALTATSVGITARVLADLGHLHDPESQVVLGAAVIDDVLGLILLAVVDRLIHNETPTVIGIAQIAAVAFGFLLATLVLGGWLVPPVVRWIERLKVPGTPVLVGLALPLGLAWLAWAVGSAPIMGAFADGLLLRRTTAARDIERGIANLGHFFVPIFFVVVGAAVNLRAFNPWDPARRSTLWTGGLLIVVAVVGKFLAGYAPVWFRGRKAVIGVGMIPRGEVGLIFAQVGLASGVFDDALFSAVTLMVMVTTLIAPPLLRWLLPSSPGELPPPASPRPPGEGTCAAGG